MIGFQQHITFKEDTHQYFDVNGVEYQSMSKVIRSVTPAFDREGISFMMAKRKAKEERISINEAQKIILNEWDDKLESSIVRGNNIHGNIHSYLDTGSCEKEVEPVAKRIAKFASQYYKFFPEAILYDSEYEIAGTADLSLQRLKTSNGIWDFYDHKTNESRGIYFDSIKREDGIIKKHFNQYLLPPMDHLESCNYNTYALQLSGYAFMAERTFNIKVGKLGILFIDNSMNIRMFPVPYMKSEILVLFNHFKDNANASWEE